MSPRFLDIALMTVACTWPQAGGKHMQATTAKDVIVSGNGCDHSELVAVMIDGIVRHLTRQELEDLDDLAASREAIEEGGSRPFEDLVRELGLD